MTLSYVAFADMVSGCVTSAKRTQIVSKLLRRPLMSKKEALAFMLTRCEENIEAAVKSKCYEVARIWTEIQDDLTKEYSNGK